MILEPPVELLYPLRVQLQVALTGEPFLATSLKNLRNIHLDSRQMDNVLQAETAVNLTG